MNDIAAQIIVKVLLTSGKEKIHTYTVPKSTKGMEDFIKDMVDRVASLSPLMRDKTSYMGYLLLENPTTIYNPDNVAGVEVGTLGMKQLGEFNDALRKAQTKVGYIKH